jgi:hypothetical protein
VHAGAGADNGGEKKNVLIASVLLPIAIDLALRCNMQRRVNVLWVCQVAILQGVAATPITVMGDAEVEDQVWLPAWSRRKLQISTSPRRCRDSVAVTQCACSSREKI